MNTATQSLPTLPHGGQAALPPPTPAPTRRNALPCRAPAGRLPRPADFHMPPRARRRDVCVRWSARERASAREGNWNVYDLTAIASDASPDSFSKFAENAVTRACTRSSHAPPRRVQRSARGVGVIRPSPANHPNARPNIDPESHNHLFSVSPDKQMSTRRLAGTAEIR
jgi:hypothetical protein